MKKYIIFDFDGTIANTNDVIIASWQATFEHYLGHSMPVRTIEATFGETLYDTIDRLLPGTPVDEVVDYYRTFQDTHQEDYPVYVFEGVRELIAQLRESGRKIGVATSRTINSFSRYMSALDMEGCVDEVVTMEDVTRHKPHPESIDRVMQKLGASPDEAIMIGDTKYDIGCANNAGVESVLVGWSHYVDMEAMAADGFEPTYRIETPGQLLDLV